MLVVDDAHRASSEVWDEIEAIRNRLTQPASFAALIIVGQTELARASMIAGSMRSRPAYTRRCI